MFQLTFYSTNNYGFPAMLLGDVLESIKKGKDYLIPTDCVNITDGGDCLETGSVRIPCDAIDFKRAANDDMHIPVKIKSGSTSGDNSRSVSTTYKG